MTHAEILRHRQREQIIKTITHLHNARHHIDKTFTRLRVVHNLDSNCNVAKTNCEAIRQGIEETIKMLARSASILRTSFNGSLEKPPAERGAHLSTKLTPKQRDLERSGLLRIQTLPRHHAPTPILRQHPPKVVDYKPKVKPEKPKRNKLDIPI
jgi:hypothetical protein